MQQENSLKSWLASSYLSGNNASYIEELYEDYLKDPESVDPHWRDFFKNLPRVNGLEADVSHAAVRDYFSHLVRQPQAPVAISADALMERKQAEVENLIDAYRTYGHLAAHLDPLGSSRPGAPELALTYQNLSTGDLDKQFRVPDLMGTPTASLRDILARLQKIYCGSMGIEYKYIVNQDEVRWIQERIEKNYPQLNFSIDEKKQILKQLISADGLEKYLGAKYVGQKRFSLEGGDTLIPVLQRIVNQGSVEGLQAAVLCMAHRGRLNVLLNVLGQSPEELFQEFEGRKNYGMTSGDVKYHLGFSADVKTSNGAVHLSLVFNPSHLEIISPVSMGSVRARQDRRDDVKRTNIMSIQMHGDASFSGQGVVMETLNLSQTRAYGIGGSVHIVINNQIGFTTSDPRDARSSLYCTDIAKMIAAPVFHVNADDPETAVFLAQLALDYRMTFHKDVVIDLVCYRRLGHNEADEPAATQPLMYQKIRAHATPAEIYAQRLIAENICTQQDVDAMVKDYQTLLDKGQQVVSTVRGGLAEENAANWTAYIGQEWNKVVNTGISWNELKKITAALDNLPKGFELQRQVGHLLAARTKMHHGEQPLDWGDAETIAYASLLVEGYPVRISGQDTQRGTFAHRHAVLHDQATGEEYIPLQHIDKKQARFEIYDSLLSEAAALGFEYGYAATDPKTLVIWEAQFGDFANGAQVIIDQFISSGEQKWQRLSGVTLFLPHGYEGQGPEHSSARLERYLQLCAENNLQVCVPTTPAQIFHLLRRQVLRPYRKPLIVMTPKSILRHKLAVSSLEDLVSGKFQLVISEVDDIKPVKIKRIILCSGKVYYDLLTKRRDSKRDDVAIIRIEQLYPFPFDEVKAELTKYKNAKEVIWCQEEPKNQGAWYYIQHNIRECLRKDQILNYAGRKASAAPAVGYPTLHQKQQAELVNEALG